MHVETITHASRTGFDTLLNEKLRGLDAARTEIQFRPVLTVASRTDDQGFLADAEVLLYTAMIVSDRAPVRNLPA